MRYAGIIKNDTAAAPGLSVSFYIQGCPFHCPGCHNPETWDFNGGKEFKSEVIDDVIYSLNCNGIHRTLSILGGEPLCPENRFLTLLLMQEVRRRSPDTPIYIWTGYTMAELEEAHGDAHLDKILEMANVIIDGRYLESMRDITLPMRGSSNQTINYIDKFEKK